MTRALLSTALLLAASAHAAAPRPVVGCTPVYPIHVDQKAFERDSRPRLSGPGARIAERARQPGVVWELGEGRTARLSLYLTKHCALGLTTGVGHESSSPDLVGAVAGFAETVRKEAPGWALSVELPNTIVLSDGAKRYSTDLPALLQARLDAATPATLGGETVGLLHTGASLFLSRPELEKSLLLIRENYLVPAWTVYDLRPHGLPRLAALFEQDAVTRADFVTFWALPD